MPRPPYLSQTPLVLETPTEEDAFKPQPVGSAVLNAHHLAHQADPEQQPGDPAAQQAAQTARQADAEERQQGDAPAWEAGPTAPRAEPGRQQGDAPAREAGRTASRAEPGRPLAGALDREAGQAAPQAAPGQQAWDAPARQAGEAASQPEPEQPGGAPAPANKVPRLRLPETPSSPSLSGSPPEQEAGEASLPADLERQLERLAQRVQLLEAGDHRAAMMAMRMDVMERLLVRMNGESIFDRVSHLERLLERMRLDAEQARTRVELRMGTCLAGLQKPQVEREQWQRHANELEKRVAELEEVAEAALTVSGAHRGEPPSHCLEANWALKRRRRMEKQMAGLEERLSEVEEEVRNTSKEGKQSEHDSAKISLAGMLDLDKQVFDLDMDVTKLRKKVQHMDMQLAALSHPSHKTSSVH